MRQVGEAYRAAGVQAILLAHGTFVGADALGILSDLSRAFPQAGSTLRQLTRRLIERMTGETGNYTTQYAELFEEALAGDGSQRIPVRLFQWSSENNHIGRADGAVRLIDDLASLGLSADERVLLWGHSHAGNVFALVTNLLGGDRDAVEAFFDAARVYYRWPLVGCIDIPIWERVRSLLEQRRTPLPALDIVTFGTPVRYGWDAGGYSQLLHFVHHRPVPGMPPWRAAFPATLDDVLGAEHGDYVQQFGIAGTNLMPSVFSWRTWWADQRLDRLFEHDVTIRELADRFRAGTRVPDEGTTLLVDYGPAEGDVAEHHAGHAIYTHREWLLFHAETVAREFYGLHERSGAVG